MTFVLLFFSPSPNYYSVQAEESEQQQQQQPDSSPPDDNFCPGFLSVGFGGRLGNQMGEYATLYAQARRLGRTPVIAEEMKNNLAGIFPNISIPSVKEFKECDFKFRTISPEDLPMLAGKFKFLTNILP